MKKISEYLFLWGIGGWIYYTLEILFRGFSHWSMFVLGGICMMFFSYQGQQVHWQDDFLLQVFRCSIFVTAAEFITGIIVNKWFALHVWDSAVHHAIYMSLRSRDLSERQYSLSSV